jgi:hypothetical protein
MPALTARELAGGDRPGAAGQPDAGPAGRGFWATVRRILGRPGDQT